MVVFLSRIKIEVSYFYEIIGYWIRPYDMIADARRWKFIPRICCKCKKRVWWFTHAR
jgi:hypothetical protein